MAVIHSIQTGIIICIVGIAAYFIYDTYRRYRAATGSVAQRLIAAARDSGTLLLHGSLAVATAVAGVIVEVGNDISPSIGDTLKQIDPKWYVIFVGVLSVLTVYVRLRPGSKDPIK